MSGYAPRGGDYREISAAEEIGGRLRALRAAAGLSQRQLAFDGCTAAYLSRLENGERIPSGHLLDELARRLGTTRAWLERGSRDVEVLIPERAVDGVVGWIREGLEDERRERPSLGPTDYAILPAILHLLDEDDRTLAEELLQPDEATS